MPLSILSFLSLVTLISQVTAWGPAKRGSGAPGHYGGPKVHDSSFHPDHILRVTYAKYPEACQTREEVLVNGTAPGPELRLKADKRSWIRVYNDMEEPHCYNFTMHWHGLSQRMAPFADGTPSASQWPIPCQHFFDYEIFPLHNESGTYFYHSHVGFQASSASGPLIVEDVGEPPYAYDEERIIFLTDYFNHTNDEIEKGLTSNPFVWSNETNAVLINGVGVAIGETAGKGDCKLPVIEVEAGKTYRFRFIGSTVISLVQFGIDQHENFTIIAADAAYTKPHTESFMQLSSGQRFDTIFKAKDESELNGVTDFLIQFETKDRPESYIGYGVLRYKAGCAVITTEPPHPPLTFSNATYDWCEYALEPLIPNNFPTADEVTRRIEIDSQQLTGDTIIWHSNGLQWNETSVPYPGDEPYLVHLYKNGPSAMPDYEAAMRNRGWDPATLTWPVKMGEVLEIIWYNTGSMVKLGGGHDFHPIHGHGGHYYDCGSGNGTYNATENERKLANYHPVRRDTTNLYRYSTKGFPGIREGWRVWRLRVEDAGVWMFHCHILQHMVMGMQTVWVMGDYEEITGIPSHDVQAYLEYGGNVVGSATRAPTVVHHFDPDDEDESSTKKKKVQKGA